MLIGGGTNNRSEALPGGALHATDIPSKVGKDLRFDEKIARFLILQFQIALLEHQSYVAHIEVCIGPLIYLSLL